MANNQHVQRMDSVELPIQGEHWREIFNKYDRNKDGKIGIHELKEILASREYEHDIPEQVAKRILQMADTDRNGFLDYQEFVRMIHNNPILKSIFGHFVHSYIRAVIPRRNHKDSQIPIRVSEPGTRTDELGDVFGVWMILISLTEIVLFCVDDAVGSTYLANGPVATAMIYDPHRRYQAWRYLSYMFVHVGPLHLIVNLAVQILLGLPLEMVHHGWRVLIIYFAGVLAGSLWTSITDPTVMLAGATGGVYALIAAHISSVIINWREMKCALLQLIIFLVIVAVDMGTAIYNRYFQELSEHIGYAAHLAGSMAGLLVGIFSLRDLEVNSCEKKLWCVSLITFLALMMTAIVWNVTFPGYFPVPKD